MIERDRVIYVARFDEAVYVFHAFRVSEEGAKDRASAGSSFLRAKDYEIARVSFLTCSYRRQDDVVIDI